MLYDFIYRIFSLIDFKVNFLLPHLQIIERLFMLRIYIKKAAHKLN